MKVKISLGQPGRIRSKRIATHDAGRNENDNDI